MGKNGFLLNDKGYLNSAGVDVMAYDDFYPAGHQSGLTLIMCNRRLAANGDIRFEQTPGQWQPVPKQLERHVDRDNNRIITKLAYPDYDAHLHGFNPIIYPDFEFEYEVIVTGRDASVEVTVNMSKPVDERFAGKLSFNLELFPGELFGKSYICNGMTGIFPRQANGPTLKQKTNYDYTGQLKPRENARADREKLAGCNKAYNPIIADDIIAMPYATGSKITICPEDDERRFTVHSVDGEISLYDGRMNHNNGWFVLSEPIPVGKTDGALHWIITPAVDEDWRYPAVVQVSALGYHTNETKKAVIEIDSREESDHEIELYRADETGMKKVLTTSGKRWGEFLRYRYLVCDFSDIKEAGVYQVRYGDSVSSLFRIASDIYERGVWQPVLEYFLPVQMCHMQVRDKYRVWHGRCHCDDARMAPVNMEHFDGAAQGESTMTPYKSGQHIENLNKGGWHDAGDFDLRIESQTGEIYNLSSAYEEFGVYWDETTIDQESQSVEIHQPDGKNDILQQIEHGAISVVNGYKALGRLYHQIICGDIRQYVLLGDPVNMTSGIPDGEDGRLVFTEDNPPRELMVAAHLAGTYRALKGYNDSLAKDCLDIAVELFKITDKHSEQYVKNEYDPGETGRDYYSQAKLHAACELLKSTGDDFYRSYIVENVDYICDNISSVGWMVSRVADKICDDAVNAKILVAMNCLKAQFEEQSKATPYGIPYEPNIWGAGWAIQEQGACYYFLHKAYPEIFSPELMYDSLQFVLGCHPGSNTKSFASGVGSDSSIVAYGMNRADWSYIPGGVVSGTALIRPDFPELLEFPFLWQQGEYVLGGGSSHYLFLVLAVREVLSRTK